MLCTNQVIKSKDQGTKIEQLTTNEAESLSYGLTIKFPELWPMCNWHKPQFEVGKNFTITLAHYCHFKDEATKAQTV